MPENQDRLAFLVGGSGLYIDSVVFNFQLNNNSNTNENLRKLSIAQLQAKIGVNLNKLNSSDRKNKHRLIRYIQRGSGKRHGSAIPHLYLVVDIDYKELHKHIESRLNNMFKNGLAQENILLRQEFPHLNIIPTIIAKKTVNNIKIENG